MLQTDVQTYHGITALGYTSRGKKRTVADTSTEVQTASDMVTLDSAAK